MKKAKPKTPPQSTELFEASTADLPKPKHPGGRPKKDINAETVLKMAQILCTDEEIGAVVGCSPDTLTRRFADLLKKGRDTGRASLRRLQYAQALKGNTAMLIFLGKNYLGQGDTPQPEKGLSMEDMLAQLAESHGLTDDEDDGSTKELADALDATGEALAQEEHDGVDPMADPDVDNDGEPN